MPRTGMKGYALCPHTCAPTGHCQNRSQTPLWRIEGGSLRRHLKTQQHSGCSPKCPAYGITDFHGRGRLLATPEQLQLYIPIVRALGTISDESISRSLLIDEHEVAGRFPVLGKSNSMHEDGEDTDVKGTDHRHLYTTADERKGDDDPSQEIHMDEESQWRDVDMDVDDPEQLFPPAYATFANRAHSVGSELSGLSEDTQFSDLFATPNVLPTIQKRPTTLKTFRLLYVPDPSRHVDDVSATWIDLAFTTRTIPTQQFQNATSTFPKLIFHASNGRLKGRDVVKARVSEWVCCPEF